MEASADGRQDPRTPTLQCSTFEVQVKQDLLRLNAPGRRSRPCVKRDEHRLGIFRQVRDID